MLVPLLFFLFMVDIKGTIDDFGQFNWCHRMAVLSCWEWRYNLSCPSQWHYSVAAICFKYYISKLSKLLTYTKDKAMVVKCFLAVQRYLYVVCTVVRRKNSVWNIYSGAKDRECRKRSVKKWIICDSVCWGVWPGSCRDIWNSIISLRIRKGAFLRVCHIALGQRRSSSFKKWLIWKCWLVGGKCQVSKKREKIPIKLLQTFSSILWKHVHIQYIALKCARMFEC